MRNLMVFITCVLFLNSCEENPPGWINEDRMKNQREEEWLTIGGNQHMQHFSPLSDINAKNVKALGYTWEFDARSPIGSIHRGLEATPIVVDGVMFTSGAWGFVYALDARTGKEIWRYDPNVDASYGRRACCDVVNRGVAVWKGKVYVGTLDGYMVCLNAADGKEIWRKDSFTDRTKAYTITSPPQVAGNIVMIGNSGGEYGVRGYITAYDLNTGDQKWRFFIVPGDPAKPYEHEEMKMAAATWDPKSSWETGGGGTVWGEAAYDPELNLLYVGTGNSTPYPIWYRSPSGGDNLFLASILAINPDNGKLVWHYQTTPGELWDYTATMNNILADIEINGKKRKVIMQAPKNGFFYVLDRATGELLSAEKYTRVNWASHVDLKTGRPVLTSQGGWYRDTPKLVIPYLGGGHNWPPMSYNPNTGLVYIPERASPQVYKAFDNYKWKPDEDNTAIDYSQTANWSIVKDQVKESLDTQTTESLLAWDPVKQKAAWKVTTGAPDGGTLSTPELVFQGTRTGYLKVYNAGTGQLLKEIFTGTGIMAAPNTYRLDGEQYVAVMAAYGGAPTCCYPADAVFHEYENYGRLIVFKLGGVVTPLPPKRNIGAIPPPPPITAGTEIIAKGSALYYQYCETCHGVGADGTNTLHPDLLRLPEAKHKLFADIVYGGLLAKSGMASFSNSLKPEDVEAIHQYIISQEHKAFAKQSGVAVK
jgi:quinohemoprotein ethanol dehydrogenase